MYSNSDNKLTKDKKINESSQKKVGEVRRFKRTNRYVVVKPKEEDMVKPITSAQPVLENEQTTSE